MKADQTQWEKDEEQIRKKLERNSINMMKSKIAQQAKANNDQSTGAVHQQQQQVDSDSQAQAGGINKEGQTGV